MSYPIFTADIKTKDHDGWGEVTTGGVALAGMSLRAGALYDRTSSRS